MYMQFCLHPVLFLVFSFFVLYSVATPAHILPHTHFHASRSPEGPHYTPFAPYISNLHTPALHWLHSPLPSLFSSRFHTYNIIAHSLFLSSHLPLPRFCQPFSVHLTLHCVPNLPSVYSSPYIMALPHGPSFSVLSPHPTLLPVWSGTVLHHTALTSLSVVRSPHSSLFTLVFCLALSLSYSL